MMLSKEKLRKILKTKQSLIVGEVGLEDLRREISRISAVKIKVCGRSSKTGEKKTVRCCLADLL